MKILGSIWTSREGSCPVAPDPCAGREGLLLARVLTLTLEEDWATALVLMQEGAVLKVCDQLILALQVRDFQNTENIKFILALLVLPLLEGSFGNS